MPPTPAENPPHPPARNGVLAGLVGAAGGGRRGFVDATGTPVVLPPSLRRVVATDERIGALLAGLGAPLVGCAGRLDGVEAVGSPHAPDVAAVTALRPDVIVTGAVDREHHLADAGLVAALRAVAPVVAVDTARAAVAEAELRALLGQIVGGRPATEPVSERRVGAP